MTYRVERIELNSPLREQIGDVVGEAFGSEADQVLRHIDQTTDVKGPRQSRYYAALEGSELIGFNAFIAHDLRLGERPVEAWQSCWTETSSKHRGKKVFQTIILHAHDDLAAGGADYVIGWPNPNSEPLFVHKLNYHRESSVKRLMPGPIASRFFGDSASPASGIDQNDEQLIALKSERHGNKLYVVREDGGVLWGVLRHRGRIPFFTVGGVRWTEAGGARRLARAMQRKLPFVAYWQIVSEQRNSLNPALGSFTESTTNPLIWFRLSEKAPDAPFDFFAGIRDVF